MLQQFSLKVYSFLCRHRRKFIFAGVLVGGVVGSVKFAQYKMTRWMEEEEAKYLEEVKKEKHFEKTQEHCFTIVEALVKPLKGTIYAEINTEAVTELLKKEKSAERKLELWNELKILVFTRMSTAVYVTALSAAIVSLQLSQLAAKVYTNTKEGKPNTISDATQRWFLSISHEFLNDGGIELISKELNKICTDLTESMPLQGLLSNTDMGSLFKSIHQRVKNSERLCFSVSDENCDNSLNIISAFVPPPSDMNLSLSEEGTLRKELVDEIWDILDSSDCITVFDECITSAFDFICVKFNNAMTANFKVASESIDSDPTDVISRSFSLALAKALPLINAQTDAVCTEALIKKILAINLLSNFSANVFESY